MSLEARHYIDWLKWPHYISFQITAQYPIIEQAPTPAVLVLVLVPVPAQQTEYFTTNVQKLYDKSIGPTPVMLVFISQWEEIQAEMDG